MGVGSGVGSGVAEWWVKVRIPIAGCMTRHIIRKGPRSEWSLASWLSDEAIASQPDRCPSLVDFLVVDLNHFLVGDRMPGMNILPAGGQRCLANVGI